ncbi:MAG: carboxypeptidase-like regulatory domain-containing protein [Candidatus Edwardsbacteria bacterium]
MIVLKQKAKGRWQIFSCFLLLFSCFFLSCGPHAKRDNPYDPINLSGKGTVKGTVSNRRGNSVSDVTVIIPSVNLAGRISETSYEITGIPPGVHKIVATAPGYSEEDTTVQVFPDKTIDNINFILYGIPKFSGDTVRSVHLFFIGPLSNEVYYVETKAKYNHPDGLDWIGDSVFVKVNQTYCRADSHPRIDDYTSYFYKYFRDASTIDTLVGRQFVFRAKDWYSKYIGESNPHILSRVIKNYPDSLDPDGYYDTLWVATDSLKWRKLTLVGDTPFCWDIKILKDSLIVWEITGIPSSQTWCKVGISLPSERYKWWVYVRDINGNLSGREGQFVVP